MGWVARWNKRTGMTLAALLVFTAAAEPTWAAGRVTLAEEALALMRHHPALDEARSKRRAAEARVDAVNSQFLPKVTVNTAVGPEVVSNPDLRATGSEWDLETRQEFALQATQVLYDGFGREAARDAARARERAARATLDALRQQTLYDGIRTYIEVVRLRDMVAVARQAEAMVRKSTEVESERVRRGSGIELEALQAKGRLQLAKERRVSLEGQLRQAVARYTRLFGHAPAVAALVPPPPPVAVLPDSVDDAVATAMSNSPLIRQAAHQVTAAAENRRQVEARRKPTISLLGSANHNVNVGSNQGRENDVSVMLQLQWDLFTGYERDAREDEAIMQHAAARDAEYMVKREVREQVSMAWDTRRTVRERVSLLANAQEIARQVIAQRQKLMDLGKDTAIGVLDAQIAEKNSAMNLVGARHEQRRADYQLLYAMGQLSLDDIKGYGRRAAQAKPDPHAASRRVAAPASEDTPLTRARAPYRGHIPDPEAPRTADSTPAAAYTITRPQPVTPTAPLTPVAAPPGNAPLFVPVDPADLGGAQ